MIRTHVIHSRALTASFAVACIACTGTADDDTVAADATTALEASEFDPAHPDAAELEDGVVGVALAYPSRWRVMRDPYLFDSHGFILAEESSDGDHGVVPVARIALDVDASPGDLAARVEELREEFAGLDLEQRDIDVAGRPGIALGPLPGAQPSIAVFVAGNDALYRIRYYREELDTRGEELLSHLRLVERTQTIAELGLLRADSPQALFGADAQRANEPRGGATDSGIAPAAGWSEWPLGNGCWGQPSSLFLQTTHSRDANGTGWSQMGTPNFWGDNTHGAWGLGRCVSPFYTNDLYAIDYYVRPGDRLYSPLASGYVTYAGWDPEGWWNYGKMVVIRDVAGKYWSLSAHLSYVNVVPGQYVTDQTLIGWGGSTGYAAPYPHVHQAYYRWAWTSRGRPFGGQGMMPTRLRFIGNGGGSYTSFSKGQWASW